MGITPAQPAPPPQLQPDAGNAISNIGNNAIPADGDGNASACIGGETTIASGHAACVLPSTRASHDDVPGTSTGTAGSDAVPHSALGPGLEDWQQLRAEQLKGVIKADTEAIAGDEVTEQMGLEQSHLQSSTEMVIIGLR